MISKEKNRIKSAKYRKTKKGLISQIFYSQLSSSKKRGMNLPSYSKYELFNWAMNQDKFHELFKQWINSNFDNKLTPSIDRIDCLQSYKIDNIQLMTWKENSKKGNIEMRNCLVKHGVNPQKAIIMFSLNGEKLNEFDSLSQAQRTTGIDKTLISRVCNNKPHSKTAGGYIWKFK